MKLLVVVDMIGMKGVTRVSDTNKNSKLYPELREQLNEEVEQVCKLIEDTLQTEPSRINSITLLDITDSMNSDMKKKYRVVNVADSLDLLTLGNLDAAFSDEPYEGLIYLNGYLHKSKDSNILAMGDTNTDSDSKYASATLNGMKLTNLLMCMYEAAYWEIPVITITGDSDTLHTSSSEFNIQGGAGTKDIINGIVNSIDTAEFMDELKFRLDEYDEDEDDKQYMNAKLPKSFTLSIQYRDPLDAIRASHYPKVELDSEREDTVVYKSTKFIDIKAALTFI